MQRFGMMSRLAALALGLVIAAATLVSVSAQGAPPHNFYGIDGTPGDTVGLVDAMGEEIGSDTVDDNGEWNIIASVDPDSVSFTLNGKSAEAEENSTGETQTQVSVTAMVMEEPAMEEGEEGDELAGDEDGEMADLDSDEEGHMEDGDTSMGDTEYPGTGSGGLADGSGVSAGLIGLLIALSVAAVAGLGLRRVRNRA